MEQTEGYQRLKAKINAFEQQLSLCNQASKECEESGKEAEQAIEAYFAKCMNALAERKSALLRDVAQKVQTQKQLVEESKAKLSSSINVCKQTIATATAIYALDKNSAETVLMTLTSMPNTNVTCVRVVGNLPVTLFDAIRNFGHITDDTHRFSIAENITTLAGSSPGNADGKGLNVKFNLPWGMCFNPQDECVYLSDYSNNAIRKLTMQGEVTTFVNINTPAGIAMNYKENTFFVASFDRCNIMKVTSSKTTSIFAGSGQQGKADGNNTSASFNRPIGIAIDQQTGNLFISEYYNHLIRKVTPQGEVSTLAGSEQGFSDGKGSNAKFYCPDGIFFNEHGQSLYVCDCGNNKLRCVQLNGEVSTVCEVPSPRSVTMTNNQIFIVSSSTHKLFKVTYQGVQKYKVEVLAGNGQKAKIDGNPSFYDPRGIVVHEPSHSCFVADHSNHVIRQVSFVNPK